MRELRRLERLVAALGAGRDRFLGLCAQIDDWSRLFDRAFEHGVAGVLWHRLDAVGFVVPAAARERAERQFAVDRLWHRRIGADLQRVLGILEQHDIRAVVLKGLVLGERVYPAPMLRPAGDLDLLIAGSDISRAREALGLAGYLPRIWKEHETPPAHAVVLTHKSGGAVDLHHHASAGFAVSITARDLIERSVRYRTEEGVWTWVLSPEDELLYLSVHAARHRFVRLGWLVDLRLFIERYPELRWHLTGAQARAFQVRRAASVTLALLQKRLRFDLPDPAWAAFEPDLRARMASLMTTTAIDRKRFYSSRSGAWAKTRLVFSNHTFRALLGDGIAAPLGYWLRSMIRSIFRLRLVDRRS